MTKATVTVVGVPAGGLEQLTPAAQAALSAAEVVFGGPRHLQLVAPLIGTAEQVAWPSPLKPALPGLFAAHAGRRIVVLGSGDPMFYGIGSTLVEVLGAGGFTVIPAPSSVSLAAAVLGWPLQDVAVVSAVGRDLTAVGAQLYPGARLMVLSSDATTPGQLGAYLEEIGYGPSEVHILSDLGAPTQAQLQTTAAALAAAVPAGVSPLNICAIAAVPGQTGDDKPLPAYRTASANACYDSDGLLTKQEIRAFTLAALAPRPGDVVWDVGGGSGSIAIEIARMHPSITAFTFERDAVRAARIRVNLRRFGTPNVHVVEGHAPAIFDECQAPTPTVVFLGGGVSDDELVDRCLNALGPGGRVVANAVTMDSEKVLLHMYESHGGNLLRVHVERAGWLGRLPAWRPAMPITQWAYTVPAEPPADA